MTTRTACLVALPLFVFRYQQFYPPLNLHYEHKCQQWKMQITSYYCENGVDFVDPLRSSQGLQTHFNNRWMLFFYFLPLSGTTNWYFESSSRYLYKNILIILYVQTKLTIFWIFSLYLLLSS